MKATRIAPPEECQAFTGRSYDYQEQASQAYWVETGISPRAWHWITTTCATPLCMNPGHMRFNEPIRLAYAAYQCIYCGLPGGTKDHLLPKHYTGLAARAAVITVPACQSCNSMLGDTLTESITERRELAHLRLRKRHRRTLAQPTFTPQEMREFGHTLKTYMKNARTKRDILLGRLAWPLDENFDLRACQKAGIEDPYAVGLLLANREEARRIAEGKL